jgi:hypothetical protein
MAESSLCHSVIQSCANLTGSGMSEPAESRESAPLHRVPSGSAASHPSLSCPVSSKPAPITMPHSCSSRAGP